MVTTQEQEFSFGKDREDDLDKQTLTRAIGCLFTRDRLCPGPSSRGDVSHPARVILWNSFGNNRSVLRLLPHIQEVTGSSLHPSPEHYTGDLTHKGAS